MFYNILVEKKTYDIIQIEGESLEDCMDRATRVYGDRWKVVMPIKEKGVKNGTTG